MEKIDQSVRRVLYWKTVLGLGSRPQISNELLALKLRSPVSLMTARRTAAEAITLLNNKDLPIIFDKDIKIINFDYSPSSDREYSHPEFVKYMHVYYPEMTVVQIGTDMSPYIQDLLLGQAEQADIIINTLASKTASFPVASQQRFIEQIDSLQKPVIRVFFGWPTQNKINSEKNNILLAFSDTPHCQQAAADALTGVNPISGKLPLRILGIATKGSGEQIPRQEMVLIPADVSSEVPHPLYFDSLRTFLLTSITDGAFPGCAIAVGCNNRIVMQEAFGRFTYDAQSKIVQTNSIYDLASVTKVVATTTVAMVLSDRGQLNLDWKVEDIIPDFKGKDKEFVTIWHLLTHTSGLPGWVQFYLTIKGKDRIVQEICRTDLIYQPGNKTIYSDLGMILMQKVLETIAQKPLNLLVNDYITKPLAMTRTFYTPDQQFLNDIVPTEMSDFHNQLIRGFVHDENTYVMGGVSGHAGLFSTVEDLAVFCQMYLNGGIYDHKRILHPNTVDIFTTRQNLVEESTRAIGWDTRSEQGSMAGDYMSMQTYGHSGFTGTTIWIDPQRNIFIVLLTNRVHPTRENQKIRKVRPVVHDFVMKALLK